MVVHHQGYMRKWLIIHERCKQRYKTDTSD